MSDEVRKLVHDLGKIPPELKRALRPGLRTAGRIVAEDAQARASWSTRIPAAIKVRVGLTGRSAGVSVVVNRKVAPHARPFEHGGRDGTFRHPVYGHRKTWVAQRARPFLAPALEAKGDAAERQIAEAVDKATRAAGFR
ncbi:HK97 gp10 family phage protein [Actinomadura rupiterrae]|uniref:HK97 gp10 family phage protein n=1 Tax=Actinomadura rupiterrae TaxID=559627 RepID=UPI0020A564A6|nr:HK97 gp10 family phage protein [Actinomadura rupiterrae]MCP2339165.1 hypothetical protein [Actinomadura rupiterrae]